MATTDSRSLASTVKKLVLVGAGGVGKTSIATRLIMKRFIDPEMTVGLDVESWTAVDTEHGVSMRIVSFDLGGQPQFRFFQSDMVAGAHLALVVFDITRYESFLELGEWLEMTSEIPASRRILVANKVDLRPMVMVDEAKSFAHQHNMPFVLVSAKEGIGFDDLEREIWAALLPQAQGTS